jgi:hypothetical protein
VTGGPGWTILDHLCRLCCGRLLRCGSEIRCADCLSIGGPSKRVAVVACYDLCFCGVTAATSVVAGRPRRQYFRCGPATLPLHPGAAEIQVNFGDRVARDASGDADESGKEKTSS